MSEAAIFRSFGPEAYQPDGEAYAQVPRKVLEKLDPWLDALISAFEGKTETFVTRKGYKKHLPKHLQGVTEQTVTNRWRAFANLFGDKDGIIHRERDKENGNLWRMTWKVPLLAKERAKPAAAKKGPESTQPGIGGKQEPSEAEVNYATFAVNHHWRFGWRLVEKPDGQIGLMPVPGAEQLDVDPAMLAALNERYREAAIVVMRSRPPQRE